MPFYPIIYLVHLTRMLQAPRYRFTVRELYSTRTYFEVVHTYDGCSKIIMHQLLTGTSGFNQLKLAGQHRTFNIMKKK